MPRINEKLPISLATLIAEANAAYERSDFAADFAIGNQPWIAATSDRYEFSRVTTAYQKERVDQEASAGENSLSNWWLRAVTSWDRGEGDVFYDANESDVFKYADSWNVDVWNEGTVSLLHATEKIFDGPVSSLANCPNGIWFIADGTVRHYDGTTFHTYTSVATHGTAQFLATDGCSAYVGTTQGVYRVLASTGAVTKLYHAHNSSDTWDVEALAIVKERLVVGVEYDGVHYVHELALNTATPPANINTTDAIYSSSSPNIQFASITETGASILVAYNVGNIGRVIAFTIDQTSTNAFGLPALSAAITVAKLPIGETINVIREYLNSYIILGTNKGLRVGVDSGGIGFTYGPLTIESEVDDVAFFGEYVYATRSIDRDPSGSDSKGLWRLDLGDNTNGVFAHACDLSVASGTPSTLTIMGVTGELVIGTENGIYIETPGEYVDSGYIKSGRIRYGTSEKKQLVSMKTNVTGSGYYGIAIASSSGQQAQFPVLSAAGTQDLDLSGYLTPDEDFTITFTLTKKVDGEQVFLPTLQEWQLRALPAPARSRTITASMLCYDEEEDINGFLRASSAWDRLRNLERLENSGAVVLWQNFATGEQRQCVIRGIQFTQVSPPSMVNGFGGIVTIQLQTVDTE